SALGSDDVRQLVYGRDWLSHCIHNHRELHRGAPRTLSADVARYGARRRRPGREYRWRGCDVEPRAAARPALVLGGDRAHLHSVRLDRREALGDAVGAGLIAARFSTPPYRPRIEAGPSSPAASSDSRARWFRAHPRQRHKSVEYVRSHARSHGYEIEHRQLIEATDRRAVGA